QFSAQGDRLAAALDRLIRVAQQPKGGSAKGQARHFGILPVDMSVVAMSPGVVEGITLLRVLTSGGQFAKGKRRHSQCHAALDELRRVVGSLCQGEKSLAKLSRFREVGANLVVHPQAPEHEE